MNFQLEKAKILPKENLSQFLEGVRQFGRLIAPVKKKEKYIFSEIDDVSKVETDYVRTILPPKKFILGYLRERFEYSPERMEFVENFKPQPQVIFGVHSCDLHGIAILDAVYLKGDNPDPRYLAARKETTLIGISCVPDDDCFCISTGTAFPDGTSWDLFFTDIGDSYFVSIGSVKGDEIIHSLESIFREISKKELSLYKRVTAEKKHLFKDKNIPDLERITQVIELEYDSEIWEEEAERCFSCGTCTNTCPTCFCYTSVDMPSIDGKVVTRIEFITSCQYPYYSLVAGGHRFHENIKERFRNRYYHKFVGYPYQIERFGCVGCGRCQHECPAGIRIVDTLKKLRGAGDEEEPGKVTNDIHSA
ncbi:4Fe-4S dicluster domain-containing protein [Desulfurobacterium indicum]|uniref:Anaerobic sulfite reductase subunit A n=1 Tax=Desulfurobacterium indicum TaxID=1914305 RepID=A0A1R1MNQ9_9BACT|nr:4Fe-4S dicluster domain-containing protein [Desulfurobacterium indicum]OMH41324.1 anaerobic sulfite reductase subunit A [Desulfurobacterium indicum]